MQEAEVQFLREQNELQIKRAKDLSNIEVCNYHCDHLCSYCAFNIKHIIIVSVIGVQVQYIG